MNYATELSQPTPEPPAATRVGSLDMANGNDRKTAVAAVLGSKMALAGEQHMRRRWSTDQDLRDQVVQSLRVALRWALEQKDARNVKGCSVALAHLERQNQEDEHLAIKQETPEVHEHRHYVKVIAGIDPEAL